MAKLEIPWVEANEDDPWDNEGRVCTQCGEWKSWTHFFVNKLARSKHHAKCTSCKYGKRPDYQITEEGRICTECEEWKTWDKFGLRADMSTGHASACKKCRAELQSDNRNVEYEAQWREDNREYLREASKKWRLDNLEYAREYDKQYYWGNRDNELVATKEYMESSAKYETHAEHLTVLEDAKEGPNGELLVKCAHDGCDNYFIPTNSEVLHRRGALEGKRRGEHRLYCSDDCKRKCGVFNKVNYQEGHPNAAKNLRVPSSVIRALAFQHHGTVCQKCGKAHGKQNLVVHHKFPFKVCYMFEVDVDNLMVVCTDCHNEIHQIEGCGFGELASIHSYYYEDEEEFDLNDYLTFNQLETQQENNSNVTVRSS